MRRERSPGPNGGVTASCAPPPGSAQQTQTLALPRRDRVVNVPLNLLFLPLARREIDSLSFQLMLCRGGPRLMDFTATVANGNGHGNGAHLVEVRYRPDLSPMVSFLSTMWNLDTVVPLSPIQRPRMTLRPL